MYHRELGSNPESINKRLEEFTSRFNWKNIDFPASINDYKVFEKKQWRYCINVLFAPFPKSNKNKYIFIEYRSKKNFTVKYQVTRIKISNNDWDKWHFLALKSELDNNGNMRCIQSFSKLMRSISSKSHKIIIAMDVYNLLAQKKH